MASYGSIAPGPDKPDADLAATETSPLVNGSDTLDPLESVSWWSKLVFGWMETILDVGNAKQRLDPEDLDVVPLPADCSTKDVVEEFYKHWQVEKRIAAESNEPITGSQSLLQAPSLFRSLAYAFGLDFARAGLLKLVHDLCIFVGPQVLHGLIHFLRDADAPMSEGLLLTLAVTLSQLTMSFCLRHYFFKCYLTGLRVRTSIVVAVYRKALVLSSGERQSRTLGEITNLMSIDAQRTQDLTTYLHAIWYSFIQIGLALFFLWRQLGPSCLGGVAVIVIMIPVTSFVAQWMGNMQKKLMKAKDIRVEVNSEILGSMKVVKLQAWEESFQKV
jgi:ABC-type bacteriocin/lantibiotic exporter with double-glycine peptidase domain